MDNGVGAEKDLMEAGAEALPDDRCGIRINGWQIESCKRSILGSLARREWEEKLGTSHLPEMVFGESSLNLLHLESGCRLHFNAFDALKGWKQESLPPVEVPAAAKWKFRSKPVQQIILDYDYTFTTPYCGSEAIELNCEQLNFKDGCQSPHWEDCDQRINLAALVSNEPILFYDEVILYEDELADNGISLLTVKVRVMPSGWFLLLRYWLRVDRVLMRLRDTRVYCSFSGDKDALPVLLRESCWKEATIQSLVAQGLPADSATYCDPNRISQRLPTVAQKIQRLKISR
ncbi:TIP41-like protein [Phalaenopsis equestris]|uniref:TIP41-like protein n=1 Tax=Phalaenopsis equestris TaxID=78828 RepID=UPI0009E32D56|nr:TIP41-like protein [Phalaenopsis equestris]